MVRLVDIVRIVGGKERRTNLVRDLNQLGVCAQLIGNTVVLHFYEEIVFTEDVLQAARFGNGSLFVTIEKRLQHVSTKTAGSCNQAFGMAL